ncbi:Quinol monooxygenase YgiN [Propionibacterium cyclohexanicum]|uniref:Quinol monooxygenase YgiN n=1 Tax=Propionibacterium cyclohexanicum TaxID=64702 RepID=A0A1H9SH28_9ACTN|nr:antibiotic biosynthesis monooxygenase [Propionibacterium cyclohexanicum]SER83915.1 Quinol monooxygenase YgiN [Propionibacterium cyclohexanicum]
MIIEQRRYELQPGEAAGFERAWSAARETLNNSGHCEQYGVLRNLDSANSYDVQIQWDSLSGLVAGFACGPHYARFQELVGPYDNRIVSQVRSAPVIANRRRGWDEELIGA